ncbi:universal stress protein [Maribacter arenosus]|uniref:Universal stress protein n=1 Tax=Maribacter arenosus TaxID=1854708 RepID=A0ABR7VAM1_9FLAO|nr:universal stress protein [Maribacter arenosus]MBD0850356.1 universal stress protein [Maribacter arenosus]
MSFTFLKREECIFYLLHAYIILPSSPDNRDNYKQKLEELADKLDTRNHSPQHKFKGLFVFGSLSNALEETILTYKIDYVFIGTKGSTAMREMFMGSNTFRTIKTVDSCPVMVVPNNLTFSTDEIMFATEFTDNPDDYELTPMLDIARIWNSTIIVVHIENRKELNAGQLKNKERLEQRLKGLSHRFQEVKEAVSVTKALHRLANENKKVGLIAMVRHKHSFFVEISRESVVKKMAFKAEVPLLVIPNIN